MNKLTLIFVGILVTLMLKQAFILAPNFGKENFWIVVGSFYLCYLSIQNYYFRAKLKTISTSNKLEKSLSLEVGMDLKLELKLRAILAKGNKIQAIKVCSEETQMGLSEAKLFVEKLDAC